MRTNCSPRYSQPGGAAGRVYNDTRPFVHSEGKCESRDLPAHLVDFQVPLPPPLPRPESLARARGGIKLSHDHSNLTIQPTISTPHRSRHFLDRRSGASSIRIARRLPTHLFNQSTTCLCPRRRVSHARLLLSPATLSNVDSICICKSRSRAQAEGKPSLSSSNPASSSLPTTSPASFGR